MRIRRTRVALAILAILTLLPLAAAPTMARDGARAEHDRIVAHWTRDRIANAVPRDFVKRGGAIALAGKPKKPPHGGGGSGGVLGASWTAGGPILARTGKVVFTMDGSDWICSGTVVDDGGRADYSLVLTAGHCAIDETNGTFATNWMFIPAFDTKPTYTCAASAYGCWTAVGLAVRNEFATAGSFNNQAVSNDWALAIVDGGGLSGSAQLDTTVGTYPLGYSGVATGNKLYAFGYPAAGKYHGSDLVYCAGAISQDSRAGDLPWGCPGTQPPAPRGSVVVGLWPGGPGREPGARSSYGYGNSAARYRPNNNPPHPAQPHPPGGARNNRGVPAAPWGPSVTAGPRGLVSGFSAGGRFSPVPNPGPGQPCGRNRVSRTDARLGRNREASPVRPVRPDRRGTPAPRPPRAGSSPRPPPRRPRGGRPR